ncbi:MAG: DUF2284 domain-containing protein [Desulfohalobiaceae bacterium]|nr:DUF2284 domain-containing protein [Desulfohalobiaceae bacterium]
MLENPYDPLMEKAIELGASAARILLTDQIVFDPRSHLKCRFGCSRWGNFWTCPPVWICPRNSSWKHLPAIRQRFSSSSKALKFHRM